MSRTLDPRLIDLYADAVARGPAALLVRHAERGPVIDLARHHEVLLTEAGKQASTTSGRDLRARIHRPIAFAHSPVPRCGQTATGLKDGFQTTADDATSLVGEVENLGSNYLRDPARVAASYLLRGKGFVRAWFDGDVDKDIIATCSEVAEQQLEALRALLAEHHAIVAVSHDWNIAAVREHVLGARFEDVGWPEFLDGVVVELDGRVRCLTTPQRRTSTKHH